MSVDRALRRSMLYGLRTFPVPLAAVCAIGAVIAVGMCLAVTVQAELYGAQGLSLGDYVAHLLMGMRQPQPVTGGISMQVLPRIPFGWMAVTLLPHALVARCSRVRGASVGAVVACGDRVGGFLGRCCATMCQVWLYWMAMLATCATYAVATGGSMSFEPSAWLALLADIPAESLASPPRGALAFWMASCCVSCALALAQLVISEAIGASVGFAVAAALVAGSLFSTMPALFGNFMMAARSTVFVVRYQVEAEGGMLHAGLSPELAAATASGLAIASIVAGAILAAQRDYRGSVSR